MLCIVLIPDVLWMQSVYIAAVILDSRIICSVHQACALASLALSEHRERGNEGLSHVCDGRVTFEGK